MLRVLIDDAAVGMRLAMPVVNPKGGNILLRQGYALDCRVIEKLRDLEVHEFWIEYPGSEDIRRFVSTAVCRKQAHIARMLANSFDRVQSTGAGASVRLDFADYRGAIRELIEELIADPLASSYVVEMAGSAANILRHSSEVSFLSIALGLKLKDYLVAQRPRLSARDAVNVVSLGLGAVLHDVGYLNLSAEELQGADAYWMDRARDADGGKANDSAGAARWQAHVIAGHKLLSGSIRPSAAGIILQHHQHFDGSGFPREVDVGISTRGRGGSHLRTSTAHGSTSPCRGLVGEEIHVFARIVCVANHFDRLRRPCQRGAPTRPRVRVLRDMLFGPMKDRFDPVVLAALPAVAPAYQPGSMVKLSNGETAVVVDWNPAHPCRPTVQLMKQESARFDLCEHADLSIVEHEGCDVVQDNFELAPDMLKGRFSGLSRDPSALRGGDPSGARAA